MIDCAIIVTCKGRLKFLKKCITGMCNQNTHYNYKVVVVDYGCPDRTTEYFYQNPLPNLQIIEVLDNTEKFNISRARNIGAIHTNAKVLAFLDADNMISSNWMTDSVTPIVNGTVDATFPFKAFKTDGAQYFGDGMINVNREVFINLRGYDEDMIGYGWEDIDLGERLRETVKFRRYYAKEILTVIEHSDELRSRYYDTTDLLNNGRRNMELANRRTKVNPYGFGSGTVKIHDIPWSWL